MKRVVHLLLWPCLAIMFGILAWLTVSMLDQEQRHVEEEQKKRLDEEVRLCLWRMDSFLTYFLLQANELSPDEFRRKQASITEQSTLDSFVAFYHESVDEHVSPFATRREDGTNLGNMQEVVDFDDADTGEAIEAVGMSSPGFGVWALSSPTISRRQFSLSVPPGGKGHSSMANQFPMRITAFSPRWERGNLILGRTVETAWTTFTQSIYLDWDKLRRFLLESTSDILPHAELVPYAEHSIRPEYVTRLLAAIPVMVEPGQPKPVDSTRGWNSLHVSLMLVWMFALAAAGGVLLLLLGMIRLNERRSVFVSAVTHELRTPLTTFNLYSDMLLHGFIPPEGFKPYLVGLKQESRRLSHLVDNVLGFSKIDQAKGIFKIEPVAGSDLSHVLMGCITPILQQAGMNAHAKIAPDVETSTVMTNTEVVGQIMRNLADNAAKYAGGSSGPIRLDLSIKGRFLQVVFTDSGPGIAGYARRKLFRPFSRSAEAAAGGKPGIGLGLALSRNLARKLGGDLSLNKHDGQGASFTLTLPLAGPVKHV